MQNPKSVSQKGKNLAGCFYGSNFLRHKSTSVVATLVKHNITKIKDFRNIVTDGEINNGYDKTNRC